MLHFIRTVCRFAIIGAFVALPARLVAQVHPPLPPGVEVDPKGSTPVILGANATTNVTFTVTNLRPFTQDFDLSCVGTGAVSSCNTTFGDVDVVLLGNTSQDLDVTVTAGSSGGTGLAILYASGPATDSGYYNITVTQVTAPTLAQPRQPDSVINRAHCVTSAAGIADWSCGDAVFMLNTPTYTTLDRARNLTLTYASSTASPQPLASVNVTLNDSEPALDHITAVLTVLDTVRTTATYAAWTDSTRQIVLGWNAGTGYPTGAYPYTLTIRAVGTGDSATASDSGLLYVVNRANSSYGAGWEWLGVERLILNQPVGSGSTNVLWVDGDGSTKLYSLIATNTWVAPHEEFQDTIKFASGEYTRTLRHGVQVIFDSTGRHVRTNNRQTQVTHFYWGTTSRIDSVTVPPAGTGGKTFILHYNGSGFLDSVRVGGRDVGVTVSSGILTQWRWPDSTSTTNLSFHVDGSNRIDSTLDARGGATRLHYGSYGLVDTAKVWYDSASSHIASVTQFRPWQAVGYGGSTAGDTAKAFTSIVGPRGAGDSAEYHVDKWGAPVAAFDPDHQTTHYVRGNARYPALVTEIDFPNARKAFMVYDTLNVGNLTVLTDSSWGTNAFPLQKTKWFYSDTNDRFSPDSVIAPDGTLSRYAYTTLGLTDSMISPRGHVTKFTYAATDDSVRGQVLSVTERAAPTWIESLQADRDTDLVTTLGYNASGNTITAQSPAGGITKYQRSAVSGLVTQLDDPVGYRQQVGYDWMDHVIRKIAVHAVGDSSNACLSAEFVCNPLIVAALNPPGTADTTLATYTHGLLSRVRDPRGVPRAFGYDLRGLMVADSDEANHTDLATYDRGGLVGKQVTRMGATLSFSYDASGRQTTWIMPQRVDTLFGTPVTAGADTIRSTYDSLGNLLVHQNRLGTITRAYYESGAIRIEQAADTGSRVLGDTVSYAYDAGGRLASLRWPRGDTTRYGYNGATGDVDSVTATWSSGSGSQTERFLFATDAMGRRRNITYPYYSMVDTLHYDRLGVLRRLVVTNTALPPTSNRFNATLLHDSVDVMGRALHEIMRCDSMTADSTTIGAPCGSWMPYESDSRYNRLGEIVQQWNTQFFDAIQTMDTLRYDASGNRDSATYLRSASSHRVTFSYPSGSNRLSTATDSIWATHVNVITTYSYDLAGSRRKDTLANKYVQAYQYDAAGRMKGTARVEPATVSFPGIGVFGVIDTVIYPNTCDYNADGLLVAGCGVQLASYVGQNVAREHDGDWWYVSGPGLDEPILAVQRTFQGVPHVTNAWLPVVSDGRGQLLVIADSGGQINSGFTGPEFDAGLWNSSGLTAHSQSFNPRRWATPGGIDTISTFRSRQYDPSTGKWLQEDPAGLAGGVNLYDYNGNDPNSFSDPFGLASCDPPGSEKCRDISISIGGYYGWGATLTVGRHEGHTVVRLEGGVGLGGGITVSDASAMPANSVAGDIKGFVGSSAAAGVTVGPLTADVTAEGGIVLGKMQDTPRITGLQSVGHKPQGSASVSASKGLGASVRFNILGFAIEW